MNARLQIATAAALVALSAQAVTIHRSFRPARYGVGGGVSVVGPGFDTKPSINFDAAPDPATRPKIKTFTGKVTQIIDGDTIMVTPNGGAKKKVVLDRIDAPEIDQPWGEESKKLLSNLVLNKKVEVKYAERDSKGATFGVVYVKTPKGVVDVNLSMILSGAAWYGGYADDIPAYRNAETSARNAKIGLWAGENPVKPADWRKARKMNM